VCWRRTGSLADLGRTDEALAMRRRSVKLDPWSLAANNSYGLILSRVGRYDESVLQFRRALEIDPAYADTRCSPTRATPCSSGSLAFRGHSALV
jgi:tetratricopeptide (TPR) repeat protein